MIEENPNHSVFHLSKADAVYVVLSIDKEEVEYITGVFKSFEDAKHFSTKCLASEFLCDVWIEKHEVL